MGQNKSRRCVVPRATIEVAIQFADFLLECAIIMRALLLLIRCLCELYASVKGGIGISGTTNRN